MTLQPFIPTNPVFSCPRCTRKVFPCPISILSSHLIFCVSLFFSFNMLCIIVFAKPDDLQMWRVYLTFNFRFLTMVIIFLNGCMRLSATILIVTWSVYEMVSKLQKHVISKIFVLFLNSNVKDHDLNIELWL